MSRAGDELQLTNGECIEDIITGVDMCSDCIIFKNHDVTYYVDQINYNLNRRRFVEDRNLVVDITQLNNLITGEITEKERCSYENIVNRRIFNFLLLIY